MEFPFTRKKEEKQTDPTPEGGVVEPKGDPPEKKTPESASDPPPTGTVEGVQSPFGADGSLAGRSEKDVVDELALQAATIQAQKEALDAGVNQPVPVVVPEPEPEPIPESSAEDFFANPGKVIGEIVSQRVQAEMKEIIAPFQADLANSQARTAWDDLKRDNMTIMRPLMEATLQKMGITSPNLSILESVYDMALGRATRQGVTVPLVGDPPPPSTTPPERQVSPQHQPSSHPIVDPVKTEEFEPLSENEAQVARESNMTHLQYRQWQAMDEADLLIPAQRRVDHD